MVPKKTSQNKGKGVTVKSAARVLDILELLASDRQSLSLTEISQRLSIPMSSLHGLVRTLHNREYLARDGKSQTYRLGPKLLTISRSYLDNSDLIVTANPVMERMHLLCGESVSLAVQDGTYVVFIAKRTSAKLVRVVNPPGTRLPLHATALGKSILACLPEEEFERLYPDEDLQRLTAYTIDKKSRLRLRLTTVRERAIAFDRQESALGVWAVGSAIRDHFGDPVAAISIVVPSVRISPELETQLSKLVLVGAAAISRSVGYADDDLPRVKGLDGLDVAWLQAQELLKRGD